AVSDCGLKYSSADFPRFKRASGPAAAPCSGREPVGTVRRGHSLILCPLPYRFRSEPAASRRKRFRFAHSKTWEEFAPSLTLRQQQRQPFSSNPIEARGARLPPDKAPDSAVSVAF